MPISSLDILDPLSICVFVALNLSQYLLQSINPLHCCLIERSLGIPGIGGHKGIPLLDPIPLGHLKLLLLGIIQSAPELLIDLIQLGIGLLALLLGNGLVGTGSSLNAYCHQENC